MDIVHIQGIEKAIEKWSLVGYGLMQSKGRLNCPLCVLYYDDDCMACPVAFMPYNQFCDNTPLTDTKSYTWLYDCPDMVKAVEQEIIFLCSLLPSEHKWYEEFVV